MYVRLLKGHLSLKLACFLYLLITQYEKKNPVLFHGIIFKTYWLIQRDICRISYVEGGFVLYDSAADFIAHLNQLRQMNSSAVGQCYDYAFSKGLMCFNCTYISRLLFCSFANSRHGYVIRGSWYEARLNVEALM